MPHVRVRCWPAAPKSTRIPPSTFFFRIFSLPSTYSPPSISSIPSLPTLLGIACSSSPRSCLATQNSSCPALHTTSSTHHQVIPARQHHSSGLFCFLLLLLCALFSLLLLLFDPGFSHPRAYSTTGIPIFRTGSALLVSSRVLQPHFTTGSSLFSISCFALIFLPLSFPPHTSLAPPSVSGPVPSSVLRQQSLDPTTPSRILWNVYSVDTAVYTGSLRVYP
ncbi:hypothetical protein ASPZODRAFT_780828 [Penicilliopsis zonata CBS 506.65]|uniref:Uncharacterized protein n=1 Tax=Penicilliopsis zonata CBS 506.65 TaxID=1073090 RepID=A0A1L9SB47_9EURO|nr:hypothetical protein ASPZODRAFT_780828 [Penicilliopsis zonata CBS 506.65]OJJ44366.1 hypothetical protein ASPZODRAFT_780828 [Penicilliopsis zonata CBS 506.65]